MIQVWNRLAIENETAVRVCDSESITTLTVATVERAFEIHAPNLIWALDVSQWFRKSCYSFFRSLGC
jgi:hypothetical protein